MKRRTLASLLAALSLSVVTGTPAIADEKRADITLTAGTEANQDGLYYATLVLLDKELKKQTGNQVKLRIYPNQQLGNEMSMIEGLRSGSLDIAVAGGANFASFVPQFQLFSVPYVFADSDKYRKAMRPDSKVWQLMQKTVADAKVGVQLMAPTTVGSRWVANTKGDVKSPADMKALALRMRVQANPIEAEVWSSYGASPVNMPMPEVVTAMRQGVVHAVENAPDILYTYKLHEVAKHLSQTDHSFYVALVLMSDRVNSKIPAALQPAVRKAFLNAGQQLLDQSAAFQEKAIAGMKAAGATVVQVDKGAFRKPIEPVYDRVAKQVGATDLLAAIRGL